MALSVVIIVLSASVLLVLGASAVAIVEYRGAEEKGADLDGEEDPGAEASGLIKDALGLARYVRGHPWRPLAGGICAGGLAGVSAAELTISGVGTWSEQHPVFAGALTGAALLGITVLIIDALMRFIASQSWQGSLKGTCTAAVRGARRGAYDLRKHLAGEAVHDLVPGTERCEEAHQMARELWVDLGDRVGRASLAAFASDEPELGEAMHQLSTAADTLQRALVRYSTKEPSKTRNRLYTSEDIKERWLDYVWWLVDVDERGRVLKYSSPVSEEQRKWLMKEMGSHTPSTVL